MPPGIDESAQADRQSDRDSYVGRICPYCRFAITTKDRVTVCRLCKTPHHSSCWYENGRCTTYGCKGVADRLAAVLPQEYRDYYDLPGLRRPRVAEPISPLKWTVPALLLTSPALVLFSTMGRFGWVLVGSLVATVLVVAVIYQRLDSPEDESRHDLLIILALLGLSVMVIVSIMLAVLSAPV